MSTKRGGASKGPPKHQNKHAYKPFLGVKKNPGEPGGSDGRSFAPIAGVCLRCKEQLEWRRKYGKYKPLVEPTKCIWCQKRNVRSAYHSICSGCANAKGACGKCCKQVRDIVGKDAAQEEAERKRLEEALSGMRERDRRTLLRAMEKGSVKVPRGVGNDAEEGDEEDSDETSSEGDENSDPEVEGINAAERIESGEAAPGSDDNKGKTPRQEARDGASESGSEWESGDEQEGKAADRTEQGSLHDQVSGQSQDSLSGIGKPIEQRGGAHLETSQGKVRSLGNRIEGSLKVEEEGMPSQTPIEPSANGA